MDYKIEQWIDSRLKEDEHRDKTHKLKIFSVDYGYYSDVGQCPALDPKEEPFVCLRIEGYDNTKEYFLLRRTFTRICKTFLAAVGEL